MSGFVLPKAHRRRRHNSPSILSKISQRPLQLERFIFKVKSTQASVTGGKTEALIFVDEKQTNSMLMKELDGIRSVHSHSSHSVAHPQAHRPSSGGVSGLTSTRMNTQQDAFNSRASLSNVHHPVIATGARSRVGHAAPAAPSSEHRVDDDGRGHADASWQHSNGVTTANGTSVVAQQSSHVDVYPAVVFNASLVNNDDGRQHSATASTTGVRNGVAGKLVAAVKNRCRQRSVDSSSRAVKSTIPRNGKPSVNGHSNSSPVGSRPSSATSSPAAHRRRASRGAKLLDALSERLHRSTASPSKKAQVGMNHEHMSTAEPQAARIERIGVDCTTGVGKHARIQGDVDIVHSELHHTARDAHRRLQHLSLDDVVESSTPTTSAQSTCSHGGQSSVHDTTNLANVYAGHNGDCEAIHAINDESPSRMQVEPMSGEHHISASTTPHITRAQHEATPPGCSRYPTDGTAPFAAKQTQCGVPTPYPTPRQQMPVDGCPSPSTSERLPACCLTNSASTEAFLANRNRFCTSYRLKVANLKNPVDTCVLPNGCLAVADYDNGCLILNRAGDTIQHVVVADNKNACGVVCSMAHHHFRLVVLAYKEGVWSINIFTRDFELVETILCPDDAMVESWAMRKISLANDDDQLYLMATGEHKLVIWSYQFEEHTWRTLVTEASRKGPYGDFALRLNLHTRDIHFLMCDVKKAQLSMVVVTENIELAGIQAIKMRRQKGQEWIVQGPKLACWDEDGDIVVYDMSGKLFLFDGQRFKCKKIVADLGKGEVGALAVKDGWCYALCRYRLCIEAYMYKDMTETPL